MCFFNSYKESPPLQRERMTDAGALSTTLWHDRVVPGFVQTFIEPLFTVFHCQQISDDQNSQQSKKRQWQHCEAQVMSHRADGEQHGDGDDTERCGR